MTVVKVSTSHITKSLYFLRNTFIAGDFDAVLMKFNEIYKILPLDFYFVHVRHAKNIVIC